MIKTNSTIALILATIAISPAVAATHADKSNTAVTNNGGPIHIKADRMTFDLHKGVFTYDGHARATKDDMILRGDKITTYQNKQHKIYKVVTIGKPAYFHKSNTHSKDDTPLTSKAETITFYPGRHLAVLTTNAWARKGNNVVTGKRITYNTQTQVLHSDAKDTQHRVHIELDDEGNLSS